MRFQVDLKDAIRRHRTIIRYVLLQLPGYALLILILGLLRSFIELPGYATWSIVGLWIVKDIVLYPVVGRFYDPDYPKDWFSMIGLTGIAQEPLNPKGYIRVKGELWKAKVLDKEVKVNAGESIIIRGIDGLTLLVEPKRPMLKLVVDKQDHKHNNA